MSREKNAARPGGGATGAPEHPPPSQPVAVALTVAAASREWITGAKNGVIKSRSGRRYGPQTVETHEYRLPLHVLTYIGRLPVTAVTPGSCAVERIEGFLESAGGR
ncbi:MAG: hypothetical protein ACR2N6_06190 [Miltoncostaeaceae bacterium]